MSIIQKYGNGSINKRSDGKYEFVLASKSYGPYETVATLVAAHQPSDTPEWTGRLKKKTEKPEKK